MHGQTKINGQVKQYSNARKARLLQSTIGRPSTEDFIRKVEGNMIPNCNITRDNIIRAEDIFGPNLGSLKGKMTRWPTQHVNTSWTSVPQEIIQQYGEVTLAIDIVAINKIPFLMMSSSNIHFGTAELLCNKTKKTLMTSIQQVARAYKSRGFCICNWYTMSSSGWIASHIRTGCMQQ